MDPLAQKTHRKSELAQAIADCRAYFWVVFLFSVVTNLLMLAFPIYMLQVYDRVLTTSHTDTLLMLTVIVGGALLVMACIDGLRTAMTLRIGGWLVDRLGPVYLASGVRARLTGHIPASNLISDLTEIRNFVSTQGLTFFCDAPWVPVFVVIIWLIHPYLGMLAAATAVVLFVISIVNDLATRSLLKRAGEINAIAIRDAEATVRNGEVVSSMGMLPAMVERWQLNHLSVLEYLRRAGERGGILVAMTKFLRLFAQVGVLGLGALLVIWGELTAGAMIACSILLGRALAPVEMAMGAWKNFTQARLAYGRLKSQLQMFPTPVKRTRLPSPTGRVTARDLSFEVSGQQILRDISLDIEPGDAIAVIGPSAAGKSTLCRCLVGLTVPSEGEVRLDDSAIQHWDPKDLGPHIGFLPQYVELFAGSIKENIGRMTFGDDEEVIAAAKLAHAHDMIQKLPEGYDTIIGDGSVGLSAGQRQRIGLARAVYGDPKFIVLDEPNANLDQMGESALAAAIAELKSRGAAIVMVGHRPSTLSEATKILLMKEGRVHMFGPRDAVLAKMRERTVAKAKRNATADETEPSSVG
jgi:PrtD family type I secretion system ABC transporter